MVRMIENGEIGLAGKRIRGVWLALLLAAVTILAGCGGSEEMTGGEQGGTLTVFAAASLTDAFGELAEDFEEQNSGVEVRTNFASSSTLATQIQQGAPADVFASANEAQMEMVAEAGLVAGEPETFVRNREVVVAPGDNPAGIEEFADLSEPGIRLVLALDEVPAAEYAMEILGNAAEDPEYGPEFEQAVLDNIVSREEDVRAAVNRVVIGDADATFGYASDVTPDIRDEVEVVEIPETLQVIPTYPIAVLDGAQNEELAREWVELVLSDEGQQVLEKWGFEPAAR
jgi:molybdate transport system substrate-binding protein